MPTRSRKAYRFQPPAEKSTKVIPSLASGLDTNSPILGSLVTVAQNVRFNSGNLFGTRSGSSQKGNIIGTASKILGLHSYIKKDDTAQLLATYNTDIYKFTESAAANTIATSTNAQGTGYSKDRNVFFTTNVDTSGNPWLVVIYQSGAGLKLEWAASPYTTWTNTVISIDGATGLGFCGHIDTNDDIYFVWEGTTTAVYYAKLTYSNAGTPTWAVPGAILIKGTGASDAAQMPSIVRFTQSDGTKRNVISYRYYDGANYAVRTVYQNDGDATPFGETVHSTPSTNVKHISALSVYYANNVILAYQVGGTSSTSYYYKAGVGSTWDVTGTLVSTDTSSTLGMFSAVPAVNGTARIAIKTDNTTSSSGLSATITGYPSNSFRTFTVVNDGANDNDIQYKNSIPGTSGSFNEDAVATRITNNALNQKYPKSPASTLITAPLIPVVFMEGTGSPYNIKINASVWVALGTTLTANKNMESCTMPSTAAGGTDQHYFVNGSNTPRKWDGTTLTAATATGYPVASWIFPMDGRLWMGGETGKENSARYTDLGSDNFTGTFPVGNRLDFPEKTLWGHFYRDSVAVIFTSKSLYLVQNFDYTGASVGPEKVRKIPDSYGILSGRTVKQIGQWIYYQRPDGQIMRTNTSWAEMVSDRIIPTLYNSVATQQFQYAAAGAMGDFYYLALTNSGSAQNDLILVLDTRQAGPGKSGGGYSIDTGKSASVFVTHPNADKTPEIFYGSSLTSNGSVYQAETGISDNGTAIDFDVETGIFPLSGLYLNDFLRDIIVLAEASGDYDLTIGIAGATNTTSYTNYSMSLDPASGTWGTGTWDSSLIWGGNTHVDEPILDVNLISKGFRLKFSNSNVNEPVSVISVALTHEAFKDIV